MGFVIYIFDRGYVAENGELIPGPLSGQIGRVEFWDRVRLYEHYSSARRYAKKHFDDFLIQTTG